MMQSGFQFEIAGPGLKELECPICLGIVRNAIELPCEHLMCKACLEHYEKEITDTSQRERLNNDNSSNNNVVFRCSVCMTPYKVEDKKSVKSMDRIAQTSVHIKCLQKQCDWVGCIKDYTDHEKKCNFIWIQCPFAQLGCFTDVLRGELMMHNETNRLAHDSLVLAALSSFADERKTYQHKINQQGEQIQNLEKLLLKNTQKIQSIEEENEKLKYKTDQQAMVSNKTTNDIENLKCDQKQLEMKIDGHELTVGNLTVAVNDMKSKTQSSESLVNINSNEINNLKTFAVRMSQLHMKLSDTNIHNENNIFNYLEEWQYVDNEDVISWNIFVDNFSEEIEEYPYLDTLEKASRRYKNTIYPKYWSERLNKLRQYLVCGVVAWNYVKLTIGPLRNIFVTIYETLAEFNEEVSKAKYCRRSALTASYRNYEESCLYIAVFYYRAIEDVWVLDWEDIEMSKSVLPGEMVALEASKHWEGDVILEINEA
ncbi:TNF receptor-associated factor 6-like [Clytia hemisphaerica]